MEFTIGQNASLPVLKMQVVNDGTQSFEDMMEFIERSSIFFSMVSTDTGVPKVYTKSAGFVEKWTQTHHLNTMFTIDLHNKIQVGLVDMKVNLCLLMMMVLWFYQLENHYL